ncbi:relaxase/mobilization nuclease domain-containing protein [Escherichia coli]|nr:relaxase/mobilization nuclease domain-containing protein [Escherichia coli]
MLAKIVSKRDDEKSSFKSLSAYIASLRDHVDPETGEVIEKGVATDTNCHSLETAWIEMWGTSARSVRVRNPVEHIVLSWEKGEHPTDDQAFKAGRMALDALGMADHQYLFAAHRDTDNDHLHIMVNKVHPERGQVPPLKFTRMTLDKTMREIELRQGWRHTNGPFAVNERDGKKVVDWKHESVQDRIAEREAKRRNKPGRARDMEAFTGNESLAEYVQRDAKKDALAALDNGGGWQELHSALSRYGLAIKPKGPGFAIHSTRDPSQTPVKASAMSQALGGGRLTKRIGEYQEPRPERQPEPRREYTKERPKRDPAVRDDRREARAAERADLRDRYRAFREDWNASKAPTRADMYERQQRRRRELAAAAKTERDSIRKSSLPVEEKRARYSLAAMGTAAARKELADEIKAERVQFRAERPQDYRAWVADRAQEGDLSAIRQVRGWAYQDRRTARAMERADTAAERGPHLAASDGQAHDPAAPRRLSERVSWNVDRDTGTVAYQLDGREAFRDSGRRIDYTTEGQRDADAIEAGLLLAREKFGGTALNITGPDEFRQRVVAVAIAKGLDVRFSDPELEQQRIEGQREHQEARTRPDWSRFRQSAVVSEERPTEPSQPAPGQQTHARAKREEEARKLAERQKQQAAGKRPDWTRFRSSSVVSDDRGAEPVQAAPPRDVPTPEPQRDDARARREAEARALAEKQRQQDTEREQEHSRDDDNSPEMP